jgi:tetratricopeptide (TPR) repeat protein
MALGVLGNLHQTQGEHEDAVSYFQRAIAIHHEAGDEFGVGTSLCNISESFLAMGRIAEAETAASEAVAVNRRIGHRDAEAHSLRQLGMAARAAGRPDEAARHWHAAAEIYEQIDSDQAAQIRAELAELGR